MIEVFADLAGLALERSERLADEAGRAQEERLLNHATQEVSRSLELEEVYRAIVSQAVRLDRRVEGDAPPLRALPAELRTVASSGFSDRVARSRITLADGMIGRVARTGKPYLSREADRDRFAHWIIDAEGIESFAHVPITIGPRLFGVLTVADSRAARLRPHDAAAPARVRAGRRRRDPQRARPPARAPRRARAHARLRARPAAAAAGLRRRPGLRAGRAAGRRRRLLRPLAAGVGRRSPC